MHTNEEILDLVTEAKGGSINAFEVLIHENKAMLYRVGVSMLKSNEDYQGQIISSPDAWIKGSYTKNNVRLLVLKVVNYIVYNLQIIMINIY